MDTTFHTKEGVFNYRVCGIIINNNKKGLEGLCYE